MATFISVQLKKTSEVDLAKPLVKFIQQTYPSGGEEQAQYCRAAEELSKLRRAALGRPLDKHEGALETLLRWVGLGPAAGRWSGPAAPRLPAPFRGLPRPRGRSRSRSRPAPPRPAPAGVGVARIPSRWAGAAGGPCSPLPAPRLPGPLPYRPRTPQRRSPRSAGARPPSTRVARSAPTAPSGHIFLEGILTFWGLRDSTLPPFLHHRENFLGQVELS